MRGYLFAAIFGNRAHIGTSTIAIHTTVVRNKYNSNLFRVISIIMWEFQLTLFK
jgi:hypothetical protein